MELAGPSVEGLSPRFDCDKIPERKETIKKLSVSSEVENNPGKENTGLPTDDCSVNMVDKFKLHIQHTSSFYQLFRTYPNRYSEKETVNTEEIQRVSRTQWKIM
uniref:Uncharacterized protein n=1 Tax=Bombyx mori TaxID=7091 RepID=A0A8R2RC62_BOMMO